MAVCIRNATISRFGVGKPPPQVLTRGHCTIGRNFIWDISPAAYRMAHPASSLCLQFEQWRCRHGGTAGAVPADINAQRIAGKYHNHNPKVLRGVCAGVRLPGVAIADRCFSRRLKAAASFSAAAATLVASASFIWMSIIAVASRSLRRWSFRAAVFFSCGIAWQQYVSALNVSTAVRNEKREKRVFQPEP